MCSTASDSKPDYSFKCNVGYFLQTNAPSVADACAGNVDLISYPYKHVVYQGRRKEFSSSL